MFLATTSLDKYWDKNQKILFLGEWCLSGKEVLKGIDYEMLPYHWTELKDSKESSQYIHEVYSKVMPILADHLNKIHKNNYSHKYWNFLIGPWLYMFISVYYDRYLSIKNAMRKGINLSTIICNKSYPPRTHIEFWELIDNGDDKYNYMLYSEIIRTLSSSIDYQYSNDDFSMSYNKQINDPIVKEKYGLSFISSFMRKIKILIIKVQNTFLSLFISYNNDVSILSLEIDKNEMSKFLKKIRLLPQFDNYQKVINTLNPKISIDEKMRTTGLGMHEKDEFLQLLNKNILWNIPIEYVENFHFNSESVSKIVNKEIKKVVHRCPVTPHTFIRYYISHAMENGAKLISMQHGGNYGVRDLHDILNFEIDLTDVYLTWGWDSNRENVHKFYVTKTNWAKDYDYKKNGPIIFIGASCRKYFTCYGQLPTYNKIHVEMSKKLIELFNNEVYDKLIYRFYHEYGYNERAMIEKAFPNIKTSLRSEEGHFYNLLYNSRLIICSNDSTTHKQSFILNHPTMILFDPAHFAVNASAQPYYDILHEAGILYYSPDKCAEKINEIYLNPMDWWMAEEVQKAKNDFSNKFCRVTNHLGNELGKLINMI